MEKIQRFFVVDTINSLRYSDKGGGLEFAQDGKFKFFLLPG